MANINNRYEKISLSGPDEIQESSLSKQPSRAPFRRPTPVFSYILDLISPKRVSCIHVSHTTVSHSLMSICITSIPKRLAPGTPHLGSCAAPFPTCSVYAHRYGHRIFRGRC